MMKLKQLYNHWIISDWAKRLLQECKAEESTKQECKAEESTKYDIDLIYCSEKNIVATDRRRLLIRECQSAIEAGIYHLTEEGFLLGPLENKTWPEYKDVIPTRKNAKVTAKIKNYREEIAIEGCIIGELYQMEVHLNTDLLLPITTIIKNITPKEIEIWCMKQHTKHRQFMLAWKDVKYIQMPLNMDGY